MARKMNAAYQLDIASPLPQPGSLFDFTHWPLLSQNSSVFNCTLRYTMASLAKSPHKQFVPRRTTKKLFTWVLQRHFVPQASAAEPNTTDPCNTVSTLLRPKQGAGSFWHCYRCRVHSPASLVYTRCRPVQFNTVDKASHTLKVSCFGGTMSYLAGHLRAPAAASFRCWKQR